MPARLRFRDIRRTSTFRLTVAFGMIFAAGTFALLALVYLQTAHELTARSDYILRTRAVALLAAGPERLPRLIAAENAGSPASLSYAALFAADGERVTGNLTYPSSLRPGVAAAARDTATGTPLRLLAVRTGAGETILVGRNVAQIAALRHTILAILLWSGAGVVVAGFAVGIALGLRPLRRVQRLAAAADEIGRGDFTARMPLAGHDDELDMFARTVNEMVDQVERVVGQVKIVTDAVAHDLRTPLARLRTRLQVMSRDEPGGPAAAMLADLDLVLDRFTALLRISELEATTGEARFIAIDLTALLTGIADLYAPLAEERGQRLTVRGVAAATVAGDTELLFEAVGNLVDNAIKFTPDGGRIDLAVTRADGGWCVSVRDNGPGIDPAERSAVLRRFYRSERANAVPGSGLGLSVVAAIAHLHRADLSLADAAPGLVVRLTMATRGAR